MSAASPSNPSDAGSPGWLAPIVELVAAADANLASAYPEGPGEPQPIHTVYLSAALADAQLPGQWGASALALAEHHEQALAVLDTHGALPRVKERLAIAPIQDLRLDFEDGYGWREDSTEDADARKAGRVLRTLSIDANPPAALGIRIKGLTSLHLRRSVRTLELVLDGASGVPRGFVTTIPKFRSLTQVEAALRLFDTLEQVHGLPSGSLRFELQIESPQAVLGSDGTVPLAKAIHLARGRLTALHYGTYDYSAACGIAAEYQSLEHPVADHAKAVMLAAAAQTGVWVCDGSTQVNPDGSPEQKAAALTRHHRLVTRALERGYWQGWDMHPGHLVTRWLATYGFHRRALAVAGPRIVAYLQRQGGGVVDEPATAQALAAGVLRGLDCGAYTDDEVAALMPGCNRAVLDQLVQRTTIGGMTGGTDQR